MKLKFKGKSGFEEYHGAVDFVDGETKDVDESIGNYLLADFGKYFEEVKPEPKSKVKNLESPPHDRMIRKGRTKKR